MVAGDTCCCLPPFKITQAMRKTITLILILICTAAMAQQKRIYFFPEFVKSRMVFKNKSRFVAMVNYDAANRKMLYKQGEQLMELTNPQDVDTIYTGGRKWVFHNRQFCEVIETEHRDTILIGWVFKNVYRGQRGALGMITQAHVQKLRAVDFMGPQNGDNMNAGMEPAQYDSWNADLEVWNKKNSNTYYFSRYGTPYSVTTLKSVYKAFPEHKTEIKAYVSENKLDMHNADKALQIIDFLLKMKP